MRIVALEEHVSIAAFSEELERSAPAERGGRSGASRRDALEDIESARLPSMDENGITLQILSVPGAGAVLLSPEAGPDYAKRYNDALAAVVRKHPARFAASRTYRPRHPQRRPTNSNARYANTASAAHC